MILDEHYGVPSFVVYVVKTPVVVVVGGCSVHCEVFLHNSLVIDVRDVEFSHFISVPQKYIHTIVVL